MFKHTASRGSSDAEKHRRHSAVTRGQLYFGMPKFENLMGRLVLGTDSTYVLPWLKVKKQLNKRKNRPKKIKGITRSNIMDLRCNWFEEL
ncbi:hypothetical protein L6452_31752 [Arctium lappa]|uniref:Uncharacterized protein n=1 Tax=Arctium lappa TaxID=4217 RepID=A0ACB8Z1W7_ARCLA|nr:hypothetical protein L6452_31752 [Arctium lappa]